MYSLKKLMAALLLTFSVAAAGFGFSTGVACAADDNELPILPIEQQDPQEFLKDISECRFVMLRTSYRYTGSEVCPENYQGSCCFYIKDGNTRLKNGEDYTVSYENNIKPGVASMTVEGIGDYKGSQKITYYVVPKKLSINNIFYDEQGIHVEWTPDSTAFAYQILICENYNFKGALSYTIKDISASSTVVRNKFSSNQRWYVKIRALITEDGTFNTRRYGDFSATRSVKTFTEHKSVMFSENTLMTYTGSALKPEITVLDSSGNPVSESDYSVQYSNNINAGKATVTVTNKANPKNVITADFMIQPARNKIKSLTSQNGAFMVSWEKGSPGTVGYQVSYSTTPDFSENVHSYTSTDLNDLSENFSRVPRAGETWYVRVRSFTTADGKQSSARYGSYSPVKSIITYNYQSVTNYDANLYAAAHYAPASLGTISSGSLVGVIGSSSNWYRLVYNGGIYWVYGRAFGNYSGVTKSNVSPANVSGFADDVLFDIGCTPSAIRYYTTANIWYNQGIPEYAARDMNAATAVKKKSGRCFNYAALADLLLERAGFDHELIKGSQHSVYHNWNAYKYPGDSSWYYMECTPLNGARLVTYGLTADTLIKYTYVWDRSKYISG